MSVRALGRALAIPLPHPRLALAASAAVLLVHLATMARELTFYDSPELALAAHQLGLGHPPGQPLHTLVGFLFAHLPGVPTLIGLGALSAIGGVGATLAAYSIATQLAGRIDRGDAILCLGTLAAFGLHRVVWEPSTRIEVYSLAFALGLYGLARTLAAHREGGEQKGALVAGLAFGLAMGAHPIVGAAHALGALPLALGKVRTSDGRRAFAWGFAGLLSGLAVYAYIPLVARREAFVWGAPTGGDALVHYLRGADYAHNQTLGFEGTVAHLLELLTWSAGNTILPLAMVGLVGWLALTARRDWALAFVPILVGTPLILFVAFNTVFHPDVPDYLGYFAGPFLLVGAGGAAGLARLAEGGGRRRTYAALALAVLTTPLALPPWHLFDGARASSELARRMIEGVGEEAPEGAFLLVEADHWAGALLYAQEVEGWRPDLVITPRGLASSSWYFAHLERRHPQLSRFELRGEGGRDGRLRRLYEANAERAVLAEHAGLAAAVNRPICGVGWLLFTSRACDATAPDPARASASLRAEAARGPELSEVSARIAMARGEALWRLGEGEPALDALLGGADHLFGVDPPTETGGLDPAPPLRGPLPAWSRRAPLHDPARNLLLARDLAGSAGRPDLAAVYLRAALEDGLPEAQIP